MTKERGGGLIFLAVGIYGLVFSIGLPLGGWNEPGPGVFPLGLSILLCLSGVLWLIQGGGKTGTGETAPARGGFRRYATAFRIVGLTAAFVLALEPLGYLLASILYLLALFAWVSRYRPWMALLLAVIFGAGSWLFFEKLLTTPLPAGLWPF
jgi:putative tricarboxylic transport membrane protein